MISWTVVVYFLKNGKPSFFSPTASETNLSLPML